MKKRVVVRTLVVGLGLMFLTIHIQAWLIILFFDVLPPEYLKTATSNLLISVLTILPPTLLVLFPYGWLVGGKSSWLQGMLVGIFCVLGFGFLRIYLAMPLLTDLPILQVMENSLQVFSSALFAFLGERTREIWSRKNSPHLQS